MKTKEILQNKLKAAETVLQNMVARAAKMDEADKAEINNMIAEKEASIELLKNQIATADAVEVEAAKITELQNKITKMENENKNPKNVKLHNYIDSAEALRDFSEVVKNSRNSAEFLKNYNAVLLKNDITPKNTFLPPAIVNEIKDAWESNAGEFLGMLNHTGLKVWTTAFEDATMTAETSRAKQWTKRGATVGTTNEGKKDEQILSFTPKTLRPAIIYKYITIDRETILEDENGILVQYVSRELAQRILQEVMTAILVGDGRGDVHTKIRSFEAIARNTTDAYVTVVTSDYLQVTKTDVMNAIAAINTEGKLVLAASKQTLLKLREKKGGYGGTVDYKSLDELAAELGVEKIFATSAMAVTPAKNETAVVIFDADAYKTVGDLKMDTFENFLLSSNAEEFLAEIYAGGGLAALKSAATVRCGESVYQPNALEITGDVNATITNDPLDVKVVNEGLEVEVTNTDENPVKTKEVSGEEEEEVNGNGE